MKYLLLIFALILGLGAAGQNEYNYSTPWYGMLGLQTNSSKYVGQGADVKASLTYVDCRAILLRKKGFVEFGVPIASYFLSGLVVKGRIPNDNGEVSILYGKLGVDCFKAAAVRIGLGGSIDARGISVKGISGYGASLKSYGTLSPLVYAKVNIGKLLIAPVFEYNALSWTNNQGTTRPGYTIAAHIVLPIGDKFGINLNPAYEKGSYKSEQGNMNSSNLSLKVGLMVRFD